MQLVDSHCHLDKLDYQQLGMDLEEVLQAASVQGVSHVLCVCTDLDNYSDVLAIARRHSHVYASAGVHPNEEPAREPSVEKLVELASDSRVIALGETGLDYYRSSADAIWQRTRFRRHIVAAKLARKPLIVHTRQARADTICTLKEEDAADVGGVMHCFTEDWDMARQALDLGFYISFSGIVTFKNADALREVAKKVPEDRLLIETDAPYLTPVPLRGKPNQPAHVRQVAGLLALLRGVSEQQMAAATTENFFRLFKGAEAAILTDRGRESH